jgi:hypothetical protein
MPALWSVQTPKKHLEGCLTRKYLNITVLEYHDIIIIYNDIFYINSTNTCLEIKYFKPWYLVDICKKVVIVMKTLGWSEILNTLKIPLYLANYGIQNIVFCILVKHQTGKTIMVFFNGFVLKL